MKSTALTAREDDHLIAVFDWASAKSGQHPELLNLFHCPNEMNLQTVTVVRGGKTRRFCPAGQRMNRKGRSKGYPDIGLDIARHGFHGLRIEVKTEGQRPSREQAQWLDRLSEAGFMALVCFGSVSTIETIAGYLEIETGL